jgi:hypothetical protein
MTYILFEFSYPKIPGFKKAIASTAMPDSWIAKSSLGSPGRQKFTRTSRQAKRFPLKIETFPQLLNVYSKNLYRRPMLSKIPLW